MQQGNTTQGAKHTEKHVGWGSTMKASIRDPSIYGLDNRAYFILTVTAFCVCAAN